MGRMRVKIVMAAGIMAVAMGCNSMGTKPAAVTGYACIAGPDEKCPDPSDYAALRSFQDKYKAPQAEQDAVNGLWLRLQQTPPQGYRWDGTKLVYVKVPVPPAVGAPSK